MRQLSFTDTEAGIELPWQQNQPTKGWQRAIAWLNDAELKAWVEVRRERFAHDQLLFYDRTSEIWRTFFDFLPMIARKVLGAIGRSGYYSLGAPAGELAVEARLDQRTLASYLSRFARDSVLERMKRGVYRIANIDLRRFTAVGCDSFSSWWQQQPDTNRSDAIDRFMAFRESQIRLRRLSRGLSEVP